MRQCPAAARRTDGGNASIGSLLIEPTWAPGHVGDGVDEAGRRLQRVRGNEHDVRHRAGP